ncbi:MAG: hypothetical protein ABS56_13850 [Lautropia sp. SCN 69-89]|nr:MAG: hypothetical protein ABS56_13850 [Lautropia sp. SCN 69-89]
MAAACSPRLQALAGAAAIALLALPVVRKPMEAGMATHMLAQFPLLVTAGALLAAACPDWLRSRIARWNALGIAGLVAAAGVLALSMIPRLLDLALADPRIDAAKWLALLLCGAALRLSWRPAGLVVQGFFLGNVLPMMAVAGVLYQEASARLCNSYRLDEQAFVGQALVGLAGAVAVAWLAWAAWRTMRDERASLGEHAGA